jgi:hypothetical protein
MKLDKAFAFAVILAWEDLRKVFDPCSAQVEYRCEPGIPLDHVTVWSTGAQSHRYRVCDYWTPAALNREGGASFVNGYRSDRQAGRDSWSHHDEPGAVHAPCGCLP